MATGGSSGGGLAAALAAVGHRAAAPKTAPGWSLKVAYPSTGPLKDGAQLRPSQAAAAPTATVAGPGLFTLIMADPDAPAPETPKARSWLHWLIVNARAGDVGRGGNGSVVTPYAGPTPPRGNHRYVFLVYEQKGPVQAAAPEARGRFQPAAWAAENLGARAPAAAAYFLASPEQ